jgi:4-amino-4-deoxy-L-arabinose transferase-like glycosyltransferase
MFASLHSGIDRLQTVVRRWASVDGDRAILSVLAVFIAAWTAFHVISYASVGLHPDMTEAYAWGRHPEAGYYKHPPLAGLITAAWFSLFPVRDWAFDLLAMINAAAALYATDLIARRHLAADKRLMVPLFLLMTPFYQFHAQRFGANQALIATWPLAVYCFLRAFNDRTVLWSLAAGVTAAVAMLGKYYSIYLMGGIVIAAFSHPQFARYLKSPSPWISVAAGFLVLLPHIAWLVTTGYMPVAYAYEVHGTSTLWSFAYYIFAYLAGGIGYVALPTFVYLVVARPKWRALKVALWPADPEMRMLAVMLAGFFLLPAVSSPIVGIKLTPLWTMPIWFLLPILLLAPAYVPWPREATVRVALSLLIVTAIADTLVAPALAWINFIRPNDAYRAYTRDLSDVMTRTWHERVHRPLTIVLSVAELSDATTFYSHDHPDSVPYFNLRFAPWVTPARLAAEGWIAVCPNDDANCLSLVPHDSRSEQQDIEITPRFLGLKGSPAKFVIFMTLPSNVAARDLPAADSHP